LPEREEGGFSAPHESLDAGAPSQPAGDPFGFR
jgi:hypothetical protein